MDRSKTNHSILIVLVVISGPANGLGTVRSNFINIPDEDGRFHHQQFEDSRVHADCVPSRRIHVDNNPKKIMKRFGS